MSARSATTSGMVTIKDIARIVGVSSSTVARALNDSPRISEETKSRVRDAAGKLGYVVHSAARLMRGESATVIGLTVPDIQNDFYATLARAVAEVCRDGGFQLMLSITEDDPDAEFEHLRALVGAQAAGAVIVPTASPLPESISLLGRLPSAQVIRRVRRIEGDWFAIDDERGIREATEHLIGEGHRRIAYVGAGEELSTGIDRLKGYRTALAAAGIAADESLVALGPPRAPFARSAFRALFAEAGPTAVISGGSQVTVGLLQAIASLGLSMPRDISFIAYSDSALYESWTPPLSAIALPVREIALAGSTALIRRIREQSRRDALAEAAPQQGALYLPRLQIRQSTASPQSIAAEAVR